jgi:plastocyanin
MYRRVVPFLIFFTAVSLSQDVKETGATIRGTITAPEMDETTEDILKGRELERYRMHGSHQHEQSGGYELSEKAVVYITGITGGSPADSPAHAVLDQRDMMFRPLVLPIVVGTSVDFPNNDLLFHNVFSYSKAGEFDLGRYPRGKKKTVTFDTPGVIKVYCDIHSYMYATILVLENGYFSTPDQDGTYVIRDVPPGTYTLNFWFGRKKVEQRTITVQPGAEVTANFEYAK